MEKYTVAVFVKKTLWKLLKLSRFGKWSKLQTHNTTLLRRLRMGTIGACLYLFVDQTSRSRPVLTSSSSNPMMPARVVLVFVTNSRLFS
jgi:hypothetical protein